MGVVVYKCFSPSKDTILRPLSRLHAKSQKPACLAFRDCQKRGGGVADEPPLTSSQGHCAGPRLHTHGQLPLVTNFSLVESHKSPVI